MTCPRLTFYCELDSKDLAQLIDETSVITDLHAFQASVGLSVPVIDEERAKVVRCLNEAGIPVIAWLHLPKELGLFLNVDNADQAVARYLKFRDWTTAHDLHFLGVGLDIEPDLRELQKYTDERRVQLLRSLPQRLFDHESVRRAQMTYQVLVMQMRADGFTVETAQLPWIVDERRMGSMLLQQVFRIVDVPTDREMLMLYTSFFKSFGAARVGIGLLGSYISDAQVVGIGSTGGGIETAVASWDEFERDLRFAAQWSSDICIHSLEGCVRRGFLARLKTLDWNRPALLPSASIHQVSRMRQVLRSLLWVSAHSAVIGVSLLGFLCLRLAGRKEHA